MITAGIHIGVSHGSIVPLAHAGWKARHIEVSIVDKTQDGRCVYMMCLARELTPQIMRQSLDWDYEFTSVVVFHVSITESTLGACRLECQYIYGGWAL
jgi:hypothetical protein